MTEAGEKLAHKLVELFHEQEVGDVIAAVGLVLLTVSASIDEKDSAIVINDSCFNDVENYIHAEHTHVMHAPADLCGLIAVLCAVFSNGDAPVTLQ
jgi:hypothetical protein